jgi:hypothetical protein
MGVRAEFVVVMTVETACVKGGNFRPQVRGSKLPQTVLKGTTRRRAARRARRRRRKTKRFGIKP